MSYIIIILKYLFFFIVNQKKLYFCNSMIEQRTKSNMPHYDGFRRSFSLNGSIFLTLTVVLDRHFFCQKVTQ